MTLNELRFVVAVAHLRHFRKAAEHCFVTQPALSSAIHKLEEELGVRLFERSRSEVVPTPIGQQLIAQAALILEQAEALKRMAREGADPLTGTLKLGVIHTVGPYLLPDLVAQLHPIAPNMPLMVEESTTSQLEQHLKQGDVDVALVALPFEVAGIQTRALYQEEFEVVVPHGHPWCSRHHVSSQDLAKETVLLLPSVHCFSTQVVESCPELGGKQALIQQGNSLETLRNMVASGMGITVLPASANSEKYRSPLLHILGFKGPAPQRRIGMAWRKSYTRQAALEVLAQALGAVTLRGVKMLPNPGLTASE